MASGPVYLFDTNAIIEAVRTGIWGAVAGGLSIETVKECEEECRRGDMLSFGYVAVEQADLDRLRAVHVPSDEEIAGIIMKEHAEGLHDGERDLFAHALHRLQPDDWLVCSPDKASVRFAVVAGYGDQIISLEVAIRRVGARVPRGLRDHFTERWLTTRRTEVHLGIL